MIFKGRSLNVSFIRATRVDTSRQNQIVQRCSYLGPLFRLIFRYGTHTKLKSDVQTDVFGIALTIIFIDHSPFSSRFIENKAEISNYIDLFGFSQSTFAF